MEDATPPHIDLLVMRQKKVLIGLAREKTACCERKQYGERITDQCGQYAEAQKELERLEDLQIRAFCLGMDDAVLVKNMDVLNKDRAVLERWSDSYIARRNASREQFGACLALCMARQEEWFCQPYVQELTCQERDQQLALLYGTQPWIDLKVARERNLALEGGEVEPGCDTKYAQLQQTLSHLRRIQIIHEQEQARRRDESR